MTLKSIAAAALIIVSGAASAATTNWGPHDPIELGTNFALGSGSLINDEFDFTLSGPTGVLAVAVTNDGGVFNLINGSISLFQVGNATPIGTFNFDSTAVNFNFGALTAGNYFYKVMAEVAPDASAGSYLLSSQLAPVPEPETYAMLLAGLAGVGYMVRRRRG